MIKDTGLKKLTDDSGNIVFTKITWAIDYDIFKPKNGRFQAFFWNELLGTHKYIEDAIQDIENHIGGNE